MASSINEREQAFENKFKMDEELRFKVHAKATKLFGGWAAAQLGITGAGADTYTLAVLEADFHKAGIHDVLEKVQKDLAAKGIKHEISHLEKQYNLHLAEAKKQLSAA